MENIKYGDILDYLDQDFYDFKLIPNEKHWYMYYLPSGESISEVGVSPDIEIGEDSDNFRIKTETDNQLEYAIKLLKG